MLERRRLVFRSFGEVLGEVERLRAEGYSRCGEWDLGEVCDHLAAAIEGAMRGIPFRASWGFRVFVGPVAWWWVKRTGRLPRGVKIPGEFVKRGVEVEGAVARLREVVAEWEGFGGEVKEHPFFGRLSRGGVEAVAPDSLWAPPGLFGAEDGGGACSVNRMVRERLGDVGFLQGAGLLTEVSRPVKG